MKLTQTSITNNSGIYRLLNLINGKSYIGQAKNIAARIKSHLLSTINENKKDYSVPIHIAIRKYGQDNFSLEILEECSTKDLNKREQYWIEHYHTWVQDPLCNGYNLTKGGNQSIRKIKLTENDVAEIKALLIANEVTYNEISLKFNISKDFIKKINNGKAWHDNRQNYPLRADHKLCKNAIYELYKYNGYAVRQETLNGELVKIFPSTSYAAKSLGNISYNKHIAHCCAGQRPSAYNYIWKLMPISEEDWKKLFN